jgi:hypothetical protein
MMDKYQKFALDMFLDAYDRTMDYQDIQSIMWKKLDVLDVVTVKEHSKHLPIEVVAMLIDETKDRLKTSFAQSKVIKTYNVTLAILAPNVVTVKAKGVNVKEAYEAAKESVATTQKIPKYKLQEYSIEEVKP